MHTDSTNLELLRSAIQVRHQCSAIHQDSFPLTEKCGNEIVWQGVVELFELKGHAMLRHCYAWIETIDDSEQKFIIIPQNGFVITPTQAVRAWLASRTVVVHPVIADSAPAKSRLETAQLQRNTTTFSTNCPTPVTITAGDLH